MRTAIDTNIISAIWTDEPRADAVRTALLRARDEGSLVISPIVYAEISAHPRATAAFLERFLGETGIETDFVVSERTWREVANRFSRYAKRRRASRGGLPKRLLADFIVAAHALTQADRLLTLDSGNFYKRDFPDLRLLAF
ncbi:MAG TPA: type II toxin-antitoxin system VapC family toxin [Bryobacteraceae bacterium]|nr:type II toxin-antitoxin system VapC family toxin [Bryobacteraceae bacterium]